MKFWPRMKSGTIADFEPGTLLRGIDFPFGLVVADADLKQVVGIDNGRFFFGGLRRDMEVYGLLEPLEVHLTLPAPTSRAAPGGDAGTKLFVMPEGPCIVVGAIEGPYWKFVNLNDCSALRPAGNASFMFERWSLGMTRPDGSFEVLQSF